MKTIYNSFKNWLIRILAGDRTVVLNAKIKGTMTTNPNFLIKDTEFWVS